jgi:hypothetical protein
MTDDATPDPITDPPVLRVVRPGLAEESESVPAASVERPWREVIRAAIGAPDCFSPAGLAVFAPHPAERARGIAAVVHLPELHLTASQCVAVERFAAHLAAPPEAEIIAAATAHARRDAAERAVLDAAMDLHRARTIKAATGSLAASPQWWAADKAERDAMERLTEAAARVEEVR